MSNLPDNAADHANHPGSPLYLPSATAWYQNAASEALQCLGLTHRTEALAIVARLRHLRDVLTTAPHTKDLGEALDRAAEDIETTIPEPSEIEHFAETRAALLFE